MYNANTIGVAISASSDATTTAPNITFPMFDRLTDGALVTNSLNRVFWSPLLTNRELKEWEVYAERQLNGMENTIASNVCYVCGNSSFEIGNPNILVELPVGTYTCGTFMERIQGSSIRALISSFQKHLLVRGETGWCRRRIVQL